MINPPATLRYNQFLKHLKPFGVVEVENRGKGSEKYLVRPNIPGTTQGPSYTIRCHGSGDTLKAGTMRACLRRLQIDPKEFWK